MEYFGDILMPGGIFEKIGNTYTSTHIFSGSIILNTIRKNGSNKDVPVDSFLISTIIATLFLRYGLIIDDYSLVEANLVRLVLSIIYLCIYYYYTPNNEKLRLWKAVGYTGIFVFLCYIWSIYENRTKMETHFRMFLWCLLIYLFLLPFIIIIRNKSSEGLSLPVILSSTLVSLGWTLYGLSTFDRILVIQNSILSVLGLMQLSLFVLYPARYYSKIKNH